MNKTDDYYIGKIEALKQKEFININMGTGYDELLEFIEQSKWEVFGTLTFKHRQTYEQAEKTLNHFWNCIDRKFYSNASYRKNIRTKRVNVIQLGFNKGSKRQNTHIHFVAKTVDDVSTNDFIDIINQVWKTKVATAGLYQIEEIKHTNATSKYLLHEFSTLGTDTLATTSTNI